jgi:predicted secreted Zn-dependent protease
MVAALGVAGTAAVAQQQAAAPAQDGKGWHHEHRGMLPSQRAEARLAYIKTALQITPAQTAQWNTFAEVVRKQAKARDAKVEEMRARFEQRQQGKDAGARPDLIQRMEMREKMLTAATANMNEYIAALKPLYASFNDSQKEIAPQVLGHHGHGGWHHMGER